MKAHSPYHRRIRVDVPHLALGVLGIEVVLIWGLVEFAGVLCSGFAEFAVVQNRGLVASRSSVGSGKRRAVIGLRIGCRAAGGSRGDRICVGISRLPDRLLAGILMGGLNRCADWQAAGSGRFLEEWA